MADQRKPNHAPLRALEASLRAASPARAVADAPPPKPPKLRRFLGFFQVSLRRPLVRWLVFGTGSVVALALFACVGLWWRLASGPIALDLATPWLTAAIEENFGSGHRVAVGGTLLERDAHGKASLRIRDIVVRDRNGTVVASAPKAEVALSGSSLLSGRPRAERLSLVGAETALRIE